MEVTETHADGLKREFKVEVRTGKPQVVYREAITGQASADETFERGGDDGPGEFVFGHVALTVAPNDRGTGHSVSWNWPAAGQEPPRNLEAIKSAIEEGIQQSFVSGPVQGYQLEDVGVTVDAVTPRDGLSTMVGYTVAAATSVRSAVKSAAPVLLSPIADVEVTTPLEKHPYVEEMYQLDGEISTNVGVMRRGAYFWRPPQVSHGPIASRPGFLALFRSNGGARSTDWSAEEYPVVWDAPSRPVLPDSLRDVAYGEFDAARLY